VYGGGRTQLLDVSCGMNAAVSDPDQRQAAFMVVLGLFNGFSLGAST
jgi:hypothetical protein